MVDETRKSGVLEQGVQFFTEGLRMIVDVLDHFVVFREVEVREGDTLWSIAERELGDGQRWREIYMLNIVDIAIEQQARAGTEVSGPTPELIYPKQRVRLLTF